jgi:competence protein ComFC
MPVILFMKSFWEYFLDLLFPKTCVNCGAEGLYLCRVCEMKLKKNEVQLCPTCGKRSPFGITHQKCRVEFGLDGLISAVPYKEPLVRKLVEYCKYKFVSDITLTMSRMIYKEIQNLELLPYFQEFIQSELICLDLASLAKVKCSNEYLIRKRKTKAQAELSDDLRKLNVKSAFQTLANPGRKKFIIIDDVSTTRSTLSEACLALKKSGAAEVWGMTFAQG